MSGGSNMSTKYILKSKDTPILTFDIVEQVSHGYKFYEIDNVIPCPGNEHLWPKGLPRSKDTKEMTYYFARKWLDKRLTVSDRPNSDLILAYGKGSKNPFGCFGINMWMSFRDTYWIVPDESDLKWTDWSPYMNPLNKAMSNIALSGVHYLAPYNVDRRPIITCEPTTAGTMRKCWVNKNDGIYLRKAFEYEDPDNRIPPVMEYYAAQVAEAMGIEHVPYTLLRYTHEDSNVETICECKCFTTEQIGFVNAVAYIDDYYIRETGNRWDRSSSWPLYDVSHHRNVFAKIFGEEFYADMMVLDSIILQRNRHWGNFGFLFNTETGEYIKPAPLHAHGYSLLVTNRDLESFLQVVREKDWDGNSKYLQFNEMAYGFVSERHIPILEKLKSFEFRQPEDAELGIKQHALDIMGEIIRIRSEKAIQLFQERIKHTRRFSIGSEQIN